MQVTIYPSKISGTITLPASKSALHRAIIAAGMANGTSTIHNVTFNDDAFYTLKALEKWGIKYTYTNQTLSIVGMPIPKTSRLSVDCGKSASTLRLLLPIFSQLKQATFIGSESLFSRPLDIYQKIYKRQNLSFDLQKTYLQISGKIKAGTYIIDNPTSSQFISGLLFYLPLLEEDSIIEINNLVSKPYVDLTIDFLKLAGIKIIIKGNQIIIPGRQTYLPFEVSIEGDLSQIGYFLTLGAFSGPITIKNVCFNSTQGDKKIIDLFTSIGANIETYDNYLIIKESKLTNFTYDLVDTPDLGLLLFALASCVDGKSTITNISRLKFKESNRLEIGLKIITALNASYKLLDEDNTIEIYGNTLPKVIDEFDSHGDHRVVFTLTSISPLLSKPLTITNAGVISKSYPRFWNDFEQLGGIIRK